MRCACWKIRASRSRPRECRNLRMLSPNGSSTKRRPRRFRLLSVQEDDQSYKQWVFRDPSLAPENFPETTSLQRSMKKFVLAGGKVGSGHGILLKK